MSEQAGSYRGTSKRELYRTEKQDKREQKEGKRVEQSEPQSLRHSKRVRQKPLCYGIDEYANEIPFSFNSKYI